MSAEKSIVPGFDKYAEMKREAEQFLEHSCPYIDVVVFRPGIVTDCDKRPAASGLGFFSDVAYKAYENNPFSN